MLALAFSPSEVGPCDPLTEAVSVRTADSRVSRGTGPFRVGEARSMLGEGLDTPLGWGLFKNKEKGVLFGNSKTYKYTID